MSADKKPAADSLQKQWQKSSAFLEALTRSRRLSETLDREREKQIAAIMQELHDNLGPNIAALRSWLSFLKTDRLDKKRLDEFVEHVGHLVDSTENSLRNILAHNQILDWRKVSMFEALKQTIFLRYPKGIKFVVKNQLPSEPPPQIKQTVAYVAREAVANVYRHAKRANQVTIELWKNDGRLFCEICDNGRTGIRRSFQGMGLQGMRQRIELLGGEFNISRDKFRHVTVVAFSLPWNSDA